MRQNKIIVVGNVWVSKQNGMVYDANGIAPTLTRGCHVGVEPKIKVVYETD